MIFRNLAQAVGGIVNVATKSGTNALHASVWEFLRNSDLDANGFFANKFGDQRNALKQNQFGVAIGGPVVFPKLYNGRNKTFFFGGYEGYRQNVASQSTGLAPTAAQLSGNFQGFNTIYNPVYGNRRSANNINPGQPNQPDCRRLRQSELSYRSLRGQRQQLY